MSDGVGRAIRHDGEAKIDKANVVARVHQKIGGLYICAKRFRVSMRQRIELQ